MMLFNRVVTAVFCFFVLLPILWLVYAAFLPTQAVLMLDLTEIGFSLENFRALAATPMWRVLAFSLLISTLTVLGQLVFGLMFAYALRTGLPLFALVLLALALPLELLMVPLYRQLQLLNLRDTIAALVIPFWASPLVIFLLTQSLRRLPWDMVEAARLDGAGELVIVWRIIAPLLRPELVAAAILGFAAHWNLVLYPRIMVERSSLMTVQVFLADLLRNNPLDWGVLGAAALITSLPLLVLYLVFEGRIIQVFETSFK